MLYITKIFHFEAAHALLGYNGECSNLHGHSYELRVTVKGNPIDDPASPKYGMVVDFKELKGIVNEHIVNVFDHALIMGGNMPEDFIAAVKRHFSKIIVVPYRPTTEMMLLDFSERIKSHLPENVKLDRLRLKETEGSYAELVIE